jgi:AmmeMemoRadiSam system protein A
MNQRKSIIRGFRGMEQELSTVQRDAILAVAEDAVRDTVDAPRAQVPDCPELHVSGLFVTLRIGGRLRGCIGFLEPLSTFAATLREAARRAATEDPRFSSVESGEVEDMTVDVTLLGPLVPLADAMDFSIGEHGLVIEAHGRRGLLLPQVAVEHGWDKTRFLEAVSEKALLPRDAWERPSSRLYRFDGTMIKGSMED